MKQRKLTTAERVLARRLEIEDRLTALNNRPQTKKPVDEWTIEDAKACADRIRAFDEIFPKSKGL
jgi:hypothetical protein